MGLISFMDASKQARADNDANDNKQ